MKQTENYEKKGVRRLIHWVNGDPVEPLEVPKISFSRRKKEGNSGLSLRRFIRAYLEEHGAEYFRKIYSIVAVLVCLTVSILLLTMVNVLPPFGEADNPVNNEVYEVYIENAQEDTGVVNAVCGLILNYRGFDTLNESHVLFIATCAVMVLLRIDHKRGVVVDAEYQDAENDRSYEPKKDRILQRTAQILVPFTLIFALNIMLNGHLSPGGGFSGGAVAGGGLILFLISFGFKKTERFFNDIVSNVIRISALTLYTVLMFYFIYMGANGIDNGIDLGTPGAILSSGIILPINLSVGFIVACTIYSLFCLFRKGGL